MVAVVEKKPRLIASFVDADFNLTWGSHNGRSLTVDVDREAAALSRRDGLISP